MAYIRIRDGYGQLNQEDVGGRRLDVDALWGNRWSVKHQNGKVNQQNWGII